MRISNYDKFPATKVEGNYQVLGSWRDITTTLNKELPKAGTLVVDCYTGVFHKELIPQFQEITHELWIDTREIFKGESEIREMTYPDVTDDAIFGFITRLKMMDFLDPQKVQQTLEKIKSCTGRVIIYGPGAQLLAPNADKIIYADMARWEIQKRMRRNEVHGLGVNDHQESLAMQYKRGFFVDWRVCDHHKQAIWNHIDYFLDSNLKGEPKMAEKEAIDKGLEATAKQPFRVVPFFDPGPWGGQWMKKVCDLDSDKVNFAWCFDCVPEENSLLLQVGKHIIELPSIDLVFFQSRQLLGEQVESRFGKEFPIRFDFLDTMEGGNLSLQVHPNTQYIRDQFGLPYTQDESYYMLDADKNACVYLGLKKGINQNQMLEELEDAQKGGAPFDAEKFVNKFPAKKHDHFLIPAGTIHCSGSNAMVLEISATPFIFTFKLWDWGRLGLDGKPRPINIKHGANVIEWHRDTDYCQKNLVSPVTEIATGEGWREERTGLHPNEFIETRRHWFTKPVVHETNGNVQVLNLVEGREVLIESPDNSFEPFVVHYAETFIVPGSVKQYTIRPYGESEGKECATIKAFVRVNP